MSPCTSSRVRNLRWRYSSNSSTHLTQHLLPPPAPLDWPCWVLTRDRWHPTYVLYCSNWCTGSILLCYSVNSLNCTGTTCAQQQCTAAKLLLGGGWHTSQDLGFLDSNRKVSYFVQVCFWSPFYTSLVPIATLLRTSVWKRLSMKRTYF